MIGHWWQRGASFIILYYLIVQRTFFSVFIVSGNKTQVHSKIKWFMDVAGCRVGEKQMPSPWKSNKHLFWISRGGGGWYRKPLTGWSCIKQTLPPPIFTSTDLLINLSLSSISFLHRGAVIGFVLRRPTVFRVSPLARPSRWQTPCCQLSV